MELSFILLGLLTFWLSALNMLMPALFTPHWMVAIISSREREGLVRDEDVTVQCQTKVLSSLLFGIAKYLASWKYDRHTARSRYYQICKACKITRLCRPISSLWYVWLCRSWDDKLQCAGKPKRAIYCVPYVCVRSPTTSPLVPQFVPLELGNVEHFLWKRRG